MQRLEEMKEKQFVINGTVAADDFNEVSRGQKFDSGLIKEPRDQLFLTVSVTASSQQINISGRK